jgi:hypothetical protein
MNYLSELEFEKEKARLLKTYNCETLDEVIEYLKLQIKMQNRQNQRILQN